MVNNHQRNFSTPDQMNIIKDGHLITWPGLTEDAINKHLKLTPATAMGQIRQNIRSTSKTPIAAQPTPDTDLGSKTHLMYAVMVDQGQLYTDLTGKFPVRSSKGSPYVMVCYYVKVIPMKSRSASEWVNANDTIHQELTVKGFKPKLQTLDNEASAALKNFFTANDVDYQLVLPHCHRRNAGTLYGGALFSRPHLSIVIVGQTLTAGGNHIESPPNLETASATIRRGSLPQPRGLQQNSL
jgi:hypothetical protein